MTRSSSEVLCSVLLSTLSKLNSASRIINPLCALRPESRYVKLHSFFRSLHPFLTSNNNICDYGDIDSNRLEEETLEMVAREFAKYLERGDAYKIYDLLPKEKRNMLSRDEFVKRYVQVYFSYVNDAKERKFQGHGSTH